MKKLTVIEERIAAIAKKEAEFVCCSFRGECAMMANTRCGIIFMLYYRSKGVVNKPDKISL